jgi:hypothetical protein
LHRKDTIGRKTEKRFSGREIMETTKLPAIMEYFSEIPDPRKNTNNRKKYPLEEVIVITILAVMSLAKGWEDIERYGKAKREMLSKFLKLEQGIPKHDVYRLVFLKLSPKRDGLPARYSGSYSA